MVTASLAMIENRVRGRKLGSLPTSVMSVPCNVVTTAGAFFPSTWRARYALMACGIA